MTIDPYECQLDNREREWREAHGETIHFVNASEEAQDFRTNLATKFGMNGKQIIISIIETLETFTLMY